MTCARGPRYPAAADTAWLATLPSGHTIHVVSATAFVATKFEAFASRGNGDYYFSHDMGDIVSVVDGRESLPDEIRDAEPALRAYVANAFSNVLQVRAFPDALQWHLPGDTASQARLPDLIDKMRRIAALASGD